ncbi:Cof-type HAD-IIB family hydrolase [Lactobacillus curvatus]|nr:Cof-type HAD-IIB family hydrolase [Latilactobacillus curvatus]MSE23817.1 Cof-type HAD-IIB family hydrolase [Latilactobacillus curvatus]
MLPKLLAIDLDGTTLNSEGEISTINQIQLRRITASGVQLVVATGRDIHSASHYLKSIGIKTAYIVSLNGAAVFKLGQSKPLMVSTISNELIDQISAIGDLDQVNTYFSTALRSYTVIRDQSLLAQFGLNERVKVIKNVTELGTDKQTVAKMLYCTKNPRLLAELVEKVQTLPIVAVKPDEMCLELTAQSTSKATGLRYLADHLQIAPTEMAAIGDSENDLEMLTFVGWSIAMANGMPHVKAIADEVTLSNDQDGLASVIQKMLG